MGFNFGFGGGGLNPISRIPTFGVMPVTSPVISGTYTGVPGDQSDSGLPGWANSLLNAGLGAYRTYLANDLANEQVARGQTPSVVPTVGGTQTLGTVVSSFSSWLPLLLLVGGVVVFIRLMSSGRR